MINFSQSDNTCRTLFFFLVVIIKMPRCTCTLIVIASLSLLIVWWMYLLQHECSIQNELDRSIYHSMVVDNKIKSSSLMDRMILEEEVDTIIDDNNGGEDDGGDDSGSDISQQMCLPSPGTANSISITIGRHQSEIGPTTVIVRQTCNGVTSEKYRFDISQIPLPTGAEPDPGCLLTQVSVITTQIFLARQTFSPMSTPPHFCYSPSQSDPNRPGEQFIVPDSIVFQISLFA